MADEKKYSLAEIDKALDHYAKEMEKQVTLAAAKQLKIIGMPKDKHKAAIQQKINIYRAGLVEIKVAIKGILETGKLPSREDLNKAKEKAGFLVPNQAPKNMGDKTFREKKTEEIEGKPDEKKEDKK